MSLGKTFIIGDSYSTFSNYLPDGYDTWYFGNETEATDVRTVEQTWWYPLFDGNDSILLRNESFSGTTICHTVRECYSVDTSFINRFDKLINEGFFKNNTPDTVFVFGGTNDNWIGAPMGKCQFDNFTDDDLLKILPACGYLAKRLKDEFPDALVCWLINTELNPDLEDGIVETANHFGQRYIKFGNIDKMSGHPSVLGMAQIRNTITDFLL